MNHQKKSDHKQTKQSNKRANQDNTPQNRQTKKSSTSKTEDQNLTSSQGSVEENTSIRPLTSSQGSDRPLTSSQGSEDDTLRSPAQSHFSKPVLIKSINISGLSNISGLKSLQERYENLRLPSSYNDDTEQAQEPDTQGPFHLVVHDELTANKDPLIGMCLR